MKPITHEDQVRSLGNVKKKPMQRDLFTGELVTGRLKRGRGDHIKLTSFEGEKAYVPGMASWANTGPQGLYCRDCAYWGDVGIKSSSSKEVDLATGVCALFVKRMGKHLFPWRDISVCGSCDKFEAPTKGGPRFWMVEANGNLIERGNDEGSDCL